MDRAVLKEWMQKTGKTLADIESATKVSSMTVRRFLAGRRIHRVNEAALERLVTTTTAQGDGAPPDRAA